MNLSISFRHLPDLLPLVSENDLPSHAGSGFYVQSETSNFECDDMRRRIHASPILGGETGTGDIRAPHPGQIVRRMLAAKTS